MRNLMRYFEDIRLRREARAWLSVEGKRAVCKAMWRLNRYAAYHPESEDEIYRLKDLLLRALCERSAYEAVACQQPALCWSCEGTGDDGRCYRCDGTGVHHRNLLVQLTFTVDNWRYVWHAPWRAVPWLHERLCPIWDQDDRFLQEYWAAGLPEVSFNKAPRDGERPLTDEHQRVLMLTVAEWLSQEGFAPGVFTGWRQALQADAAAVRRGLRLL